MAYLYMSGTVELLTTAAAYGAAIGTAAAAGTYKGLSSAYGTGGSGGGGSFGQSSFSSTRVSPGAGYSLSEGVSPASGGGNIAMRGIRRLHLILTGWHFEGSDAINGPFKNYTIDDVVNDKDWIMLEEWQVGTHNNDVGAIEMKFVHKRTGAELVFNGDSPHELMNQVGIRGTPNYVNPMRLQDIKGIGSALKFGLSVIGHGAMDVVPFKIGGDVRGPDPD